MTGTLRDRAKAASRDEAERMAAQNRALDEATKAKAQAGVDEAFYLAFAAHIERPVTQYCTGPGTLGRWVVRFTCDDLDFEAHFPTTHTKNRHAALAGQFDLFLRRLRPGITYQGPTDYRPPDVPADEHLFRVTSLADLGMLVEHLELMEL